MRSTINLIFFSKGTILKLILHNRAACNALIITIITILLKIQIFSISVLIAGRRTELHIRILEKIRICAFISTLICIILIIFWNYFNVLIFFTLNHAFFISKLNILYYFCYLKYVWSLMQFSAWINAISLILDFMNIFIRTFCST